MIRRSLSFLRHLATDKLESPDSVLHLSSTHLWLMLLIGAVVCPSAAAQLPVEPQMIDFGEVELSPASVSERIILNGDAFHEGGTIESIKLESGGGRGFTVQGKLRLPAFVQQPVVEVVEFSPTGHQLFTDALLVSWSGYISGGVPTSGVERVSLRGVGKCQTAFADCTPNGPICNVVKNDVPYMQYALQDFQQSVLPMIEDHYTSHRSAIDKYVLPVSFVWRIVGIDRLLDQPSLDCCGKYVEFERLSIAKARFAWDGRPLSLSSKKIPGVDLEILIEVPQQLTGVGLTYPGVSEFHYDPASQPKLRIVHNGTTYFDGSIACTSTKGWSAAVIRDPNSSGSVDWNMEAIPVD